ncbi:MAG: universal stress protein [Brachymonas sp.]
MKILLPVDGSDLSLHEVRFALRLVQEGLKASFVLANVQEPASFYEIITARNDAQMLESVQQEAGADTVAPSADLLKAAGVPFDVVVLAGDPAPAMLELIEVRAIDMVVMGSRALGTIRSALEGSTSRKLVHDAPVPVLLVKAPVEET